jgi:hypothetical protein
MKLVLSYMGANLKSEYKLSAIASERLTEKIRLTFSRKEEEEYQEIEIELNQEEINSLKIALIHNTTYK